MREQTAKERVRRDLRRLFRCMDQVAKHPALVRSGRSALSGMLGEVYQQLGLAWEFLGLQCRHWDGFRRTRKGVLACPICGKVKDASEAWLLLPRDGRKQIGRMRLPRGKAMFPDKKTATIVSDAIDFHGAALRVDVTEQHKSSILGRAINIAEDRVVRLAERGIECWVDSSLVHLRLVPLSGKDARRWTGAMVWELPRKRLRQLPVLVDFDGRGRFAGLCVFSSRPRTKRER